MYEESSCNAAGEQVKKTNLLLFKLPRGNELTIWLRLNAAKGRSTFLQESVTSLGQPKAGPPVKAGRGLLVNMVSQCDIETKETC